MGHMNETQTLVDSLARRLQRPVGVDDRRFRAIAYSSHGNEVDEVRRISILGRKAPEAVIDWLDEQGVRGARAAIRLPANPRLAMVARVCQPVCFHDLVLGFLWLVDEPPLSVTELELCRECAAELGDELYRTRLQADDERAREASWVEALLGAERPFPEGMTRIASDQAYAAIVVEVALAHDAVAPGAVDVRLWEAVDQVRRSVAPRHQMAQVNGVQATIIIAASGLREVDRHAAALRDAAREELVGVEGATVVVGVGERVTSLDELRGSAAHAHVAVRLARSMPELGPLANWDELGVIRLVAELVGDRTAGEFVPRSLQRLLAEPDSGQLVLSLELFLENAGDVAAAASELFVHRSSLYNRLRRIEELAGVDLRSGADRLEMHLGLYLWRMTGGSTELSFDRDSARRGATDTSESRSAGH
jgi:sugar diacid utilization regulator